MGEETEFMMWIKALGTMAVGCFIIILSLGLPLVMALKVLWWFTAIIF